MDQDEAQGPAPAGSIRVSASPGRAEVDLAGEIDLLVVGELRARLHQLLVDGHIHLTIDLSGVTFVDSSGLGALVVAQRETRVYRGSMVLVAPGPAVSRVLAVTSLDKVFDIRPALVDG